MLFFAVFTNTLNRRRLIDNLQHCLSQIIKIISWVFKYWKIIKYPCWLTWVIYRFQQIECRNQQVIIFVICLSTINILIHNLRLKRMNLKCNLIIFVKRKKKELKGSKWNISRWRLRIPDDSSNFWNLVIDFVDRKPRQQVIQLYLVPVIKNDVTTYLCKISTIVV